MRTRRRLIYHFSEQWREAYDIATCSAKLSEREREWLEATRSAGDAAFSPIKMAEDARQEMMDKRWMSKEVRDNFEKVLTRIDTYAKIVDVAIQHNPEITYVYH